METTQMDLEDNTFKEQVVSYLRRVKKALSFARKKKVIATLLALVLLPLTVILVRTAIRYASRAASAKLYFEPSSANLPPNLTLRLMVDSGNTQVGFARVQINFDRTKIQLASEITTSNQLTMNNADAESDPNYTPPQYACRGATQCIIKTPMVDANSSGIITLVLAKDPRSSSSAPSGIFELAALDFTPVTSAQTTTQITVTGYQLVDMSANEFSVAASGANLTLNPQGPTPTPPTGNIISNLVVNDSSNALDWSVRSNLQLGDVIYGDRSFTLVHAPQDYLGLSWIRTANDSKIYANNPVATFTVATDAIVYVAHDDRLTTKPSWLNNWTVSGQEFITSEVVNGANLTFSIFSKSFTAGQTVSLGPNRASGDTSSGHSMYIVVVRGITPTSTPTTKPTNTPTPKPTNTPTLTNTPPQPSLTATATPVPCNIPGDANFDCRVDGLDYAIWWINFGNSTTEGKSVGDFNNDGTVDGLDYAIWWLNFGKGPG